jgi:GMP synthase (glutamine-hydrolysing)
MAPRLACLHHLGQPFLGTAERPLREAGLELVEYDMLAGAELPDLDAVDGILSFGGDQSVRDIDRHPYLLAEAELMRQAHEQRLPVLGVCLGAQLLAHALGGEVRRLQKRLLEWSELQPLPAASSDAVGSALPRPLYALHWNEDCFEPPPGAVELIERGGEGCEAFRAGACAWGVQFHPDANSAVLDSWYAIDPIWVLQAGVSEADARAEDARHVSAQEHLAGAIFGAFAEVVKASAGNSRGG